MDGRAGESRGATVEAANKRQGGTRGGIGLEVGAALPGSGGKLKLANQTRYLCNLIVTLIKIASDEDPRRGADDVIRRIPVMREFYSERCSDREREREGEAYTHRAQSVVVVLRNEKRKKKTIHGI